MKLFQTDIYMMWLKQTVMILRFSLLVGLLLATVLVLNSLATWHYHYVKVRSHLSLAEFPF